MALATTVLAGESGELIKLLAQESELGTPGGVVSLTWDPCGAVLAVLAGLLHLLDSRDFNF